MVDQDKLGLYKKRKLDKVKRELEGIQESGKEAIIIIAKRLEKELLDQGYEVGIHIDIWHHSGSEIEIRAEGNKIGGEPTQEWLDQHRCMYNSLGSDTGLVVNEGINLNTGNRKDR
jgi:hypothetical protein